MTIDPRPLLLFVALIYGGFDLQQTLHKFLYLFDLHPDSHTESEGSESGGCKLCFAAREAYMRTGKNNDLLCKYSIIEVLLFLVFRNKHLCSRG